MSESLDDLKSQINTLTKAVSNLKKNPPLQDHFHNGFDTSRVDWSNITTKKIYIAHSIYGTDAATAAKYGVFFIAPVPCYVSGFKEVHKTAGTDAGTVTLGLEKLTGTQALDAGVAVLSATLSLKATADTVQSGTLTTTLANRNLSTGDRLALDDSGTLTSVAGVTIIVELTLT
jgi:hypothetical protein